MAIEEKSSFRLGEWLVVPSLHRISRVDDVRQLEPKVMRVLVDTLQQFIPIEEITLAPSDWARYHHSLKCRSGVTIIGSVHSEKGMQSWLAGPPISGSD